MTIDPVTTEVIRLCPCDRCGAMSWVRVSKLRPAEPGNGGSTPYVLELCKHHYEQHAKSLAAQGWTVVVDNREDLTPGGES